MKNRKIVLLFVISSFLGACGQDEGNVLNAELLGHWKLVETLTDPGDGSGKFRKVESQKIVTFHRNGIVTSNGRLCDLSLEGNNSTSGTYSAATLTIKSDDCESSYNYNEYHFVQNGIILIIDYVCIEGCLGKYRKL